MVRYQKLGRVELNVTQLESARRFYVEVVGLQYVDTGADGGVRLTRITIASCCIWPAKRDCGALVSCSRT
jgi:predicted enzyme related to lactoylglutathione lyase